VQYSTVNCLQTDLVPGGGRELEAGEEQEHAQEGGGEDGEEGEEGGPEEKPREGPPRRGGAPPSPSCPEAVLPRQAPAPVHTGIAPSMHPHPSDQSAIPGGTEREGEGQRGLGVLDVREYQGVKCVVWGYKLVRKNMLRPPERRGGGELTTATAAGAAGGAGEEVGGQLAHRHHRVEHRERQLGQR